MEINPPEMFNNITFVDAYIKNIDFHASMRVLFQDVRIFFIDTDYDPTSALYVSFHTGGSGSKYYDHTTHTHGNATDNELIYFFVGLKKM